MSVTTETMLPGQFADLERFAPDWALDRERDRYAKRLASSIDELQEFYDAATARAEEAMTYLDSVGLDELSDRDTNLLRLLYALCSVGFAVDCFKQPRIPDSGAAYLDVTVEPYP